MEADPGDDGLRSSERSESQNVGEGATLSMVFPEFDLDSPDVQTAVPFFQGGGRFSTRVAAERRGSESPG
jgi:hypothetical protein